MSIRSSWIVITLALLVGLSWGDNKQTQTTSGPTPITEGGRIAIIRALNGELVFIRKPFPMGTKGIVIKPDGSQVPDGQDLQEALAINGPAAMPGDRARITNLILKKNMIIFEINGGPLRKKKWYQRIEVGGMGGSTPVAPQANELAKGSFVAVQFDKFIPQITPEQLKLRLAGVFDFSAHSSFEAYVNTLPPKAKQAIKDHKVLVGMDRQMVTYSLGRPERKIREKQGDIPYEEWIYGAPPQEVKFVRFVGDEVTRLEIMQVDGEKVVRTAKEVDLNTGKEEAQAKPAAPAQAPTLRRPGEKPGDVGVPIGSTAPPQSQPKLPRPDIGDPSSGQPPPDMGGSQPFPR